MRKLLFTLIVVAGCSSLSAQIQRPMASPQGKLEQKVGLTDIKVEYYRPSKNERTIFGDVVPYGELWRTGANENTKFTCSDAIVIGKDTLKAGTYAVFTKPTTNNWEVVFYTETTNWGTPDEWDEKKVALRTNATVTMLNDLVETFTISVDKITTKSAELTFSWDKTRASLNFVVPTSIKMQTSIDKVMGGPTGGDYYAAAEFYFKEKKDMNKALEWVNKAVESRPEAYWILRLKSQIQAELGDYKGAVATAKLSLAAAEKEGNKAYIDMNQASIEAWSKKK